jgi:glycosyltransferase involved in cell wall biosynthesis
MAGSVRVATVGYGCPGAARLPWPQYHLERRDDFVFPELPYIWRDFCGDDNGILLTIHDISRMLWLADPNFCKDEQLAAWLKEMREHKKMRLWGYFPIDACSVGGRLNLQMGHILKGYDRCLAYSSWASDVISNTINDGQLKADWLPHGIDTSVFKPRDHKQARQFFLPRLQGKVAWPTPDKPVSPNIPRDALAIGIVATNQSRKDYGLAIQAIAEIANSREVFIWIHTDTLKREWSILELLSAYGLIEATVVTQGRLSDDIMAHCYSAMDVTLGIGRGEGFGYPIFESMACGTPCIHGYYGGAPEFMNPEHLVEPAGLRIEGPWNLLRPVGNPKEWADRILSATETAALFSPQLDWNNLWPKWEKWIEEGLR